MVKPGDNLYQIARKFNTTVDKLITLNNLKNTTLSVGQILIVREVS
ncbi:MAG: LysM peptidoglycan-binding domain-containing protein [Bacilli bacterium]|nr:LysM peptidoglycan-binding domain-containing protein [Bacilli bacterium]